MFNQRPTTRARFLSTCMVALLVLAINYFTFTHRNAFTTSTPETQFKGNKREEGGRNEEKAAALPTPRPKTNPTSSDGNLYQASYQSFQRIDDNDIFIAHDGSRIQDVGDGHGSVLENDSKRVYDEIDRYDTSLTAESEDEDDSDTESVDDLPSWDPNWWKPYVNQIASKPWTSWTSNGGQNNNSYGWCVIPNESEKEKNFSRKVGLYFVKVPKSASSTCAAVTIQVGQNAAERIRAENHVNSTTADINVMGSSSDEVDGVHRHLEGNGVRNRVDRSSNRGKARSYENMQKIKRKNDAERFFEKYASHPAAGPNGSRQYQKFHQKKKNFFETKSDCITHYEHGYSYVQRQSPYLLWTAIRDPTKRAISNFFFRKVSRERRTPTAPMMIEYLRGSKNTQVSYIGKIKALNKERRRYISKLRYPLKQASQENILEMLRKDILDSYHFIAVAERMDESLVAMRLLFDLDPTDVIVLSSKTHGGFDEGKFNNICNKIQSPFTFPEVDDYIDNEYMTSNYDFFLYDLANRTLDLTIDALGRDVVDGEVSFHRELQHIANEQCQSSAIFPCSENGTLQIEASEASCFDGDIGCGHECIKQVLEPYRTKYTKQKN